MGKRRRDTKRITVQTLPLLRDDLTAYFRSVSAGELDEMGQEWAQLHPDAPPLNLELADAELWYVTEPMSKLVYAAADSLPSDAILTDWIPSPSGILVWERGIGYSAPGVIGYREGSEVVRDRHILGAIWALGQHESVQISPLAEAPAAPFGIWPIAIPTGQAGHPGFARTQAALVTSWLLASQPTIGRTHQHATSLRRARMRSIDMPMAVTVATLREIARPDDPGDGIGPGNATGRHVSVRFLVRGHWRNQACGPKRALRKPTWVAPYVKGPDDAPVRMTDKVNVWRR